MPNTGIKGYTETLNRLSVPGKSLNESEVEEAISLLKAHGEEITKNIYEGLFNIEDLHNKIALVSSERPYKEDPKEEIRSIINEVKQRLQTIGYFERYFDIDIKGAMLDHYSNRAYYAYDISTTEYLVILRALKNWYLDTSIHSKASADIQDALNSIEESIKVEGADDKSKVALAISIILAVLNRENELRSSAEANNRYIDFIKNPTAFLDEPIGSINIGLFGADEHEVHEVAEKLYNHMRDREYFGKGFPEYSEFIKEFPDFEDRMPEIMGKTYDSVPATKLSTIMMMNFYTNVSSQLSTKLNSIENPLTIGTVSNEIGRINGIIGETVKKNKISPEEIGIAETLLKFLRDLKYGKMQSDKRSLDYYD